MNRCMFYPARSASLRRRWAALRREWDCVSRLISTRGRGNYTEAARYLFRVRDLYHHLGEPKTWQTLIADLRERNRRLPTLQDELNKAGL
jgi:uncharacterized Zn finger protein